MRLMQSMVIFLNFVRLSDNFFLPFPCVVLKVVLQFLTVIVILQFISGAVVRYQYCLKVHKCIIFQHYLTMLGATLAIPFILSGPMCFANNTLVISEVLSTIFFVSGLVTLLQSTFGVRYIPYLKLSIIHKNCV